MKFDDASWHYSGDFPDDLPIEAGATHIAMFVAWCLLNDLAGDIHINEYSQDLENLKNRELSPGSWFIQNCDEKFTHNDLNETGLKFTQFYYDSEDAQYIEVYEATLGEGISHLYAVPDTWESYDKLAPYIKKDFDEWAKNG